MPQAAAPQFYVDQAGNSLGTFCGVVLEDGTELPPEVPAGAIQVDSEPQNGLQIYDHEKKDWKPLNPKFFAKAELGTLDSLVSRYVEDRYDDGKIPDLPQEQVDAIAQKKALREKL